MGNQTITIDYFGDGLGTAGKNLGFMIEPTFQRAVAFAAEGNQGAFGPGAPDVRWRQHIACFAAKNGMSLEGDFVECGVNTGLLSMALCQYLDFEKCDKKLYLFDTYNGIPIEQLEMSERPLAQSHNKEYYFDCFEKAKANFRNYPNAVLVRGLLPDTLDQISIDKIAYLSIDLNQVNAERAVAERLWDKLVRGAVIVLDDYAWRGHELQYEMWNEFAARHSKVVATLPTGQGLIVR